MKPQTIGAIALGPSGNAQGGVKFLSLLSGQVIYPHVNDYKLLPMPADAIIRVERLARRSPIGLIFGDCLNNIIPDDPANDVENDPDYDPANDNNGNNDDHASITGVNNNNADHSNTDITGVNINNNDDGSDQYPIGFKIYKTFNGTEHEGTITAYEANNQLYQISYDDGDQEEFYHNEVNQHQHSTGYSNVTTTDFKIQKSDNDTEYCNFVNSVQFLDQ